MKYFLLAFLILLNFEIEAKNNEIKIIAIIGDEIITNYDLEQRVRLVELNSNLKIDKNYLKAIYNQVREQLITEITYKIEASKYKLEAKNEQIEQVYNNFLKEKNISKKKLEIDLRDNDIDIASFKSQIKASIDWQNILYYKISPDIVISDTEIDDYIQNIANEEDNFEYLVQIISFPINNNKYETALLLKDIYQKYQENKLSFAEISKNYSLSKLEEPVWKLKSEFDEEMQRNLQIITAGGLSKPIKYKDSYKFLYLQEKRIKKTQQKNMKLRNETKQKLYMKKLESESQKLTDHLKKTIYIERKEF
jgi:peptidyl-prolyl cis-trans isomerase SurA